MRRRIKTARRYYLVFDIEATGQSVAGYKDRITKMTYAPNDMLCLGACIADSVTGKIVDEIIIYFKPRHGEFVWEQRCLDEFWHKTTENMYMKTLILGEIEKQGVDQFEGIDKFYNWVNVLHLDKIKEMVVMCDTAGFDYGFISHYLNEAGYMPMSYLLGGEYTVVEDTASFQRGVAKMLPSDEQSGSTEAALRALGKPETYIENPYDHSHNPLDDAKNLAFEMMAFDRIIKEQRKK